VHVVVIGSGLLGLSTAYFLRRHGADVTVLERCLGPGLETSFANGGLLTPSMPEPWNAPGVWRELLRPRRADESAPMILRWRALPSLASWGILFLKNSRRVSFDANTRKNALLASYSLEVLSQLRRDSPFDYRGAGGGTLRIFRDAASLNRAGDRARRLAEFGVRSRQMTAAEAVDIEPCLQDVLEHVLGAIHYPDDETGDAHQFCLGLAAEARSAGVQLKYDTCATGWKIHRDRVLAVQTRRGPVEADHFVLAAGSASTSLAGELGIKLPMRPVKGYSLTCPMPSHGPSVAVIDDGMHAAVVPLGDRLRIAGTAEFVGFDRRISPARIDSLLELLRAIYPVIHARLDRTSATAWAGLRPMSADGVPILGATRLLNLSLNTGHGHLGWTMAAGSGRVLADWIVGQAPQINIGDYEVSRFSEKG
jgi:D-amino-acid dehydrogenase